MPVEPHDLEVRLTGLADWDAPQFLHHEWNHVRDLLTVQQPDKAKRLVEWWLGALELKVATAPESVPAEAIRAFARENSWREGPLRKLAAKVREGDDRFVRRWRWVARGYGFALKRLASHADDVGKLDQLPVPAVGADADPALKHLSPPWEGAEDPESDRYFTFRERTTRRELIRRNVAARLLVSDPEPAAFDVGLVHQPTIEEMRQVRDSLRRLSAEVDTVIEPFGTFEDFVAQSFRAPDGQRQKKG